jgi:stress response protein YsnF
VVLTEERAVASKETVAVERIKLGTQTVQGTETVQAELREEQIDLDTDAGVKAGKTDKR